MKFQEFFQFYLHVCQSMRLVGSNPDSCVLIIVIAQASFKGSCCLSFMPLIVSEITVILAYGYTSWYLIINRRTSIFIKFDNNSNRQVRGMLIVGKYQINYNTSCTIAKANICPQLVHCKHHMCSFCKENNRF